ILLGSGPENAWLCAVSQYRRWHSPRLKIWFHCENLPCAFSPLRCVPRVHLLASGDVPRLKPALVPHPLLPSLLYLADRCAQLLPIWSLHVGLQVGHQHPAPSSTRRGQWWFLGSSDERRVGTDGRGRRAG